MSQASKLLTKGLSAGYAGKTVIEKITRGGFVLEISHYEEKVGTYHDEWLPTRTGGGQELAQTENEFYTRLYAGGVIAPEKLMDLGITEKDVIVYLIKKVGALGDKTRLFEDCIPDPDGDWQYSYRVTDRIPSVELTRSLETIHYKGVQVFIHGFEICLVRK